MQIKESPERSIVPADTSVEDIVQSTADIGIVGAASYPEDCREEDVLTRRNEGTENADRNRRKKPKEETIGRDTGIMRHHSRRYVALKIMYFGQRFHGFSSEGQMDPTVESEFFKALKQTKLLIGEKAESQYSRCGRTDKGVSSVGQVVSLFLRSNLKDMQLVANCEENAPKGRCDEEIDYVKVLNKVLPSDIRVLGWCPAPIDLHARFSCLSREYKYLFWRENLDISAMEIAGKKFVGEHDFRNFCKMDAMNVHNYRRNILSFEISACDGRSEDDQIWAITIKGSSFLWHQVRCMVAVLFMIGQGLESPSVIDILLDTSKIPRKPQYTMAPELPLILYSCEFSGLRFVCSPDGQKAVYEHLKHEFLSYRLKAFIFHTALLSCSSAMTDGSPLGYPKKKKAVHVTLMSRPTEPSYEERCAKLKSRKQSTSESIPLGKVCKN